MIEILEKIIKKIYFVESCKSEWNPECLDNRASLCESCCEGIEMLEKLKEIKRQEEIRRNTI